MKSVRIAFTTLVASALAAATLSIAPVDPAYACGGPCPTTDKANNGGGQEKHAKYGYNADGTVVQDGETPGSDEGQGVPQGGPNEGEPGYVSKQDQPGGER